jgi:hypothetical protein
MRALVLGLVGAACSRAPAASPVAEPEVTDVRPVSAADVGSKRGSTMSADEPTLVAYFEAKGWGKPAEITAFERVPGLYLAEFSDGGEYVVVHGGKIVTARGLAAAGAYMRDVKLLSHKPDAKDLTTLLTLFEALPPIEAMAPDQFYDFPKHAELNPRVELGADRATLVLSYLLPRRGGPTANPKLLKVMRWTLTIPRDYQLTWAEEATTLDAGAP